MPCYDYSCPMCGGVRENVLHSIAERENPSEETIKEITCYCSNPNGTRMLQAYLTAPGIKTPTRNRFNLAQRKVRNKKHFKQHVLPTITDPQTRQHHINKLKG